jgi:Arc/MetJ family transcription regulator
MSRTNIDLDDRLVKEGLKLTKLTTKKELVNYALEDLIKKIRKKGILKCEGNIKWEGDLNEMRGSRV